MNPTALPLHLCAAGMRMAGYMLETNLRVARVLNHAALNTNPLTVGAGIKDHARPSMPQHNPVRASVTPRKRTTASNVESSAAPLADRISESASSAEPVEQAQAVVAKTPVAATAPAPRKRRARAPSTPPAMPARASAEASGKGPPGTSGTGA